jgi:hypothetical protein
MTPSRWLDETKDPGLRRLRLALDEAPAHVPSEARRRRVWAALRARRPRRWPARWMAATLLAGALATAVLVWWVRLAAPLPIADQRSPAWPAFELITAAGGPSSRVLPGGAEVQLLPGTAVAVERDRAPVLRAGRARFHVPHQPAGRHFAVRAGDVEVRVVGTRFEVGLERGRVSVSVSEGVVEVWTGTRGGARQAMAALLRAGERWSDAPEPPVERPRDTAGPAPARHPSAEAAELAAARAERDADPRHAVALYRRLAGGRGPEAENALYELGEIYRERLQSPRAGLEAWQQYRARFPRGLLRAEVDVSVMETLAMIGDRTRALEEAGDFLRHHPDSERRQEVARVAGDLARASGDCRTAVGYYDRALQAPGSGRDADDAAFARATCLGELHDLGARDAASAYLARFPAGRHATAARALVENQGPRPR